MGNNQSTEQIRGANNARPRTHQIGPPHLVSLRRVDLSAQDGASPSPFSSPAPPRATLSAPRPAPSPALPPGSWPALSPGLPPATLSASSPALSPTLPTSTSPALSPARSPRFRSTGRAQEEIATTSPATHVPQRPLSIIPEAGCTESTYSDATPRTKPSAMFTNNSSASARLGIADFNSFLVLATNTDIETAISLLREIKKHASPEDLVALHQALEPEKCAEPIDLSKLTSSSSHPSVQGCICGLSKGLGPQLTSKRVSSTPRLGSLICDEKTWAGREFLRTLTSLQDRPTSPHPECLRIVPPTPNSSVPDAIESRHDEGKSERGDLLHLSRETARKPSAATSKSKGSPTTPPHPQRTDSLSPPPTGESGYSSGSSGKSSNSWHQYKAASGWGLASRCESPLVIDSTDQKCSRRYVAFNAFSDNLTGSNCACDRGSTTAVKLQSISSHSSSIVQKRLQKRKPAPIFQDTKLREPDTRRSTFSRRWVWDPSSPNNATRDDRELGTLAQEAADRVKNKTPHPARQVTRQIAELEADKPSLPSQGRSLSLSHYRSNEYKTDIIQLSELEASHPWPTVASHSRTRSSSVPCRKSQLFELEADRPSTPVRKHKRRSCLVCQRSSSMSDITALDAHLLAELEMHRPLTAPLSMQGRERDPSSCPKRTSKERSIAHHASIADLGATANSLGSVLYDMGVIGVIPDPDNNGFGSKQDVQQRHHCQQQGKSQDNPEVPVKEKSRAAQSLHDAPSASMIDKSKYCSETKALTKSHLPSSVEQVAEPIIDINKASLPQTAYRSASTVHSDKTISSAINEVLLAPITYIPEPEAQQHADTISSTNRNKPSTSQCASMAQALAVNSVSTPPSPQHNGTTSPTTRTAPGSPQYAWLSQPPVGTSLPTTPSDSSRKQSQWRKQSQISHLVARFELADTNTNTKGSRELHRNASMPTMRHRRFD